MSAYDNTNVVLRTCSNIINPSVIRLVSNWNFNGYSDWVIPSLDDLYALKTNQVLINASLAQGYKLTTGGQNYWSSTINGGNNQVYCVSFGAYYSGNNIFGFGQGQLVRPVRYF
jgi:hypothetical protein